MNKHTSSVSLIDGHIEDITDAEVIEALEWHLNSGTNCDECPYKDFKKTNRNCVRKMLENALDLINRQQAEIKQLETIERVATKTIEKQDAEIEMLTEERDFYKAPSSLLAKGIEQIKSEAIKELAELVKMEFYKEFDELIPSIMADKIDNLVKEMTEVSE